jgi:hypothetical protein
MAKATRRYHSKTTGKYISRKQWLRQGKKGVSKREKIGTVPPDKRRKKKEPEATPGGEQKTIERLQYTSEKGTIDIDIIRIGGKLSQIKISKRTGRTKTYSRKSDIAKFSSMIHSARTQSALNKNERELEDIEDE